MPNDSEVSKRIASAIQALEESGDLKEARIKPQIGQIIQFEFDKLPPTLNQMLRMKRYARDALLDSWSWWMFEQAYNELLLTPGPRLRSVRIIFELHVYRLMDWDNASARFKIPGDALVNAAVIFDDSPKIVKEYSVRQKQVPQNKQGFTIYIEVLE